MSIKELKAVTTRIDEVSKNGGKTELKLNGVARVIYGSDFAELSEMLDQTALVIAYAESGFQIMFERIAEKKGNNYNIGTFKKFVQDSLNDKINAKLDETMID